MEDGETFWMWSGLRSGIDVLTWKMPCNRGTEEPALPFDIDKLTNRVLSGPSLYMDRVSLSPLADALV